MAPSNSLEGGTDDNEETEGTAVVFVPEPGGCAEGSVGSEVGFDDEGRRCAGALDVVVLLEGRVSGSSWA